MTQDLFCSGLLGVLRNTSGSYCLARPNTGKMLSCRHLILDYLNIKSIYAIMTDDNSQECEKRQSYWHPRFNDERREDASQKKLSLFLFLAKSSLDDYRHVYLISTLRSNLLGFVKHAAGGNQKVQGKLKNERCSDFSTRI